MTTAHEHRDIVLCGGGLAGLCLARQLTLEGGSRDALILEREKGPLPNAVKVGESMFETGTHYLADALGLRDYLEQAHVRKMGMRFFFGGGTGMRFEDRPELGSARYPETFQTYQMDRGPLENHLRELVQQAGVELRAGVTIEGVRIGEGGAPHEVDYLDEEGRARTVSCRWLIDATGRRRLVQRTLSLGRPTTSGHSAVWLYSSPWIDVEHFVAPSNEAWHARVPEGNRSFSTVQLCGDGYWVWLIGLPGDRMSIGIVVREQDHPFERISTQAAALDWLAAHEPELAAALGRAQLSGFRTARNYSYGSARIFSANRWACVGEAAAFADPLLANGVDVIGIVNLITGKLIELDEAGQLDAATVDTINEFVLSFCTGATHVLQHIYPYLGRDLVACCRMLWNFLNGWVLTGPWVFDRHLLGPAMIEAATRETMRLAIYNQRMGRLFDEWAAKSERRGTFDLLDYFTLPFVRESRLRHVQRSESLEALVAKYRQTLDTMEELALAIFLLAVEDVLPEELPALEAHGWLNAAGVGLDPSRWKKERLWRPKTAPRDLAPVRDALRAKFRRAESGWALPSVAI